MKPCGNSLISALKRIRETQHRRGGLEEKDGVYHKKAEEVYRESVASQPMIVSNVVTHAKGGDWLQQSQATTSAEPRHLKYSLLK